MNRSIRFAPALLAVALAACGGAPVSPMPDGGNPDPAEQPLEVTTKQGKVRGVAESASRVFKGLPFAAPPVGPNRFRAPQPPAAWDGVRDADKYGPMCPQFGATSGDLDPKSAEDCLTLNVWTPQKISSPRPVMVWLHGGAFILGSGSDPQYEGLNLGEAGNVIVVTVNYRLGPLGFLAHPALTAEDAAGGSGGNFGLQDQQAALRWVKENIAAFGGDPANVTVFGESAGGMSVCSHLASPKSAGLFQHAIIESGPCLVFVPPDRATWEKQGEALATAVGCREADAAAQRACLRGKPAADIMKALPRKLEIIFGEGYSWTPHVDGVVLPEQPLKIFQGGKFNKVPLVVGANKDEGTLFVALGAKVDTEMQLRAALLSMYPQPIVEQLVAHYGLMPSPKEVALKALSDAFVCDARRVARLVSAAQTPVYYYHFTRAFQWIFPNLGAFHAAEIPYIFGNPFAFIPIKEEEKPFSVQMQGYWTRFAASGDPNKGAPMGVVAWPAYTEAGDSHLELDLMIKTGTGLRKETCDFWDKLIP